MPGGGFRGRTLLVGGALAVGSAVAVAVEVEATVSVGRGSGVVGGVELPLPHASTSAAGEIIAAPITTERMTSFIGDRPEGEN